MLVIARRLGERLLIGEAEVKVVRLSPSEVKLAIKAPRSVIITRAELLDDSEPPPSPK
jgi:carbon storage regulator CsrA